MKHEEYISICEEAVSLMDAEKYTDAIRLLENLSNTPWTETDRGYNDLLSTLYYTVEDYNLALEFAIKAVEIAPDSEISSLGVYLAYIAKGESENAIFELKRYLDKYPADLYKDTLVELLDGFKNGYALDYKDIVLPLAKKNNINM